jgi:hypothetical protein
MVRIIGHDFDLRDWQDNLKVPFDPFVEVVQLPGGNGNLIDAYVLTSTQFSTCNDHGEVRELAIPLLRQLNGLMAAFYGSSEVQFSEVILRKPDGTLQRNYFLVAQAGSYRLRGSAVQLIVSGQVQQAIPSAAQNALSKLNNNLAAALEHFNRADNWHDLYKAFEAIGLHVGGRDAMLTFGVTRREIDNFALSAQQIRHHRPGARPRNTLNLEEGRQLVARLIRACLT